MWTSRPDPAVNGPLDTESFKCPTCASNIFYQPEVKGMESYYDAAQHTKLNVEDYRFRHELAESDMKEKEELADHRGR